MSTIQLITGNTWAKPLAIVSAVITLLMITGLVLLRLAHSKHKEGMETCFIIVLGLSLILTQIGAFNIDTDVKNKQIENAYGISDFHFNKFFQPSVDDNDSFDVRFVDSHNKPRTGKAVIKNKKLTLYVYNMDNTLKLYKTTK